MESYPQMIHEQQGQAPATSDDLYAQQMQEDKIRNVIEQISPDHQLMDLQWRIKGYIRNPVTKQWQKINKDAPEVSDLLVSKYISYLSSILNQNTTLSNLSSQEINGIMKLVIEWLVDDLDSNAEIYGFKNDYTERTRIGHLILNQTYIALKRCQNGMESRRIFKALNVNENLNPGQNQKGGMLDAFKFWKN